LGARGRALLYVLSVRLIRLVLLTFLLRLTRPPQIINPPDEIFGKLVHGLHGLRLKCCFDRAIARLETPPTLFYPLLACHCLALAKKPDCVSHLLLCLRRKQINKVLFVPVKLAQDAKLADMAFVVNSLVFSQAAQSCVDIELVEGEGRLNGVLHIDLTAFIFRYLQMLT
jgi:hypothetical protein